MRRTLRVISVLAVCLLVLTSGAFAAPVPTASAQTLYYVEIDGSVTDNAIVQHPLPGSIVTIGMAPYYDSDGKWYTVSTVTDEHGRYSVELSSEHPGPYRGYIKAQHTNYWAMESWLVTKWHADGQYHFNSALMSGSGHGAYRKWVGLRNSWYGAVYSHLPPGEFDYPEKDEWGDAVYEMQDYVWAGNPTLLLVVGEVITEDPDDGGIRFWFPKPSGVPDDDHITYQEKPGLNIEELLDYCDDYDNNIKVFLQIEPGHADVTKLIDIVMGHVAMDDKTGELHRSVVGFGIDLEYYKDSDITCNDDPETCGQQMTDTAADVFERLVKRYSPDLQLLLKHFGRIDHYPEWNKFPPTYRGDIIFINDSQGFEPEDDLDEFEVCVYEMEMFADYYAPNAVIFQQGYEADYDWWDDLDSPKVGTYGDALLDIGNTVQPVGFLWVDFTMREVLGSFGVSPFSWVAGASYDVGDQALYNGSTWDCAYAHTAQADWYPGAPGVWFWSQVLEGNEWVSGRAYVAGDVVTYAGSTWECLYAHTSQADWYPGAPGLWFWEEQ